MKASTREEPGPGSLGERTENKHDSHQRTKADEHMLLEVAEEHLSVRSHQHAHHESNAHDRGPNSRGAHIVHRFEVLSKGQLPVLRLKRVASPLIAWGGDDASCKDSDAEDAGLRKESLRSHGAAQRTAHEAPRPAIAL